MPIQNFLSKSISFQQLDLIILDLPQKEVFHSAIGVRKSRKAMIVKWTDQDGNIGFGECSARPDPFYSSEFMEGAVLLIQHFVVPRLKKDQTYHELLDALKGIRGWPFTKAAVEFAAHDLISKRDGETIFGHWNKPNLDKIPVGISIGLQPNLEAMKQTIAKNQAANYHRLKFKISPKSNREYFNLVKEKANNNFVSFDANGTFHPKDFELLSYFISNFNTPIEQPFPPSRVDFHQKAIPQMPQLRICLDEEIKSIGDLIKAHQLGYIDELNLKLGRVGGLVNSIEIAEYCFENDIPIWVGGMFETGIGRALNIQFAAFCLDAKAHDLSPSSRYFLEDVLENEIMMDENGYVNVATAKATQVSENILEKYTIKRLKLKI
jgi:O-succinylbenzoate synthase